MSVAHNRPVPASPTSAATLVSSISRVLPSGTVIGQKYRIDQVLVEGGMGVVYKGTHVGLDKPVAIKVVKAEYVQQREAVARFLNEARAAAQLRGIHVAHVLDTGKTDAGGPYLVMEYLQGCDLRALLCESTRLPAPLAVSYVLQACEAVAEAHSAGIVHRDLKPENLFLARMPDGSHLIKVIDFGISKRLGASERSFTVAGQTLGSPLYMAPEQMRHPECVEPSADIWSLGVVLYELLAGQTPFEAETLPAVCLKVCSETPAPLSKHGVEVPEALEQAVMRCLNKDPLARFQSVQELAEALLPFSGPAQDSVIRRIENLCAGAALPAAAPSAAARISAHVRTGVRAHETTGIPAALDSAPSVDFRPRMPRAKIVAALLGVGLFAGAHWLPSGPSWLDVTSGNGVMSRVRSVFSSMDDAASPSNLPTLSAASPDSAAKATEASAADMHASSESDPSKPHVIIETVNAELPVANVARRNQARARYNRSTPPAQPSRPAPEVSSLKLPPPEKLTPVPKGPQFETLVPDFVRSPKPAESKVDDTKSADTSPKPALTPVHNGNASPLDQLIDPYAKSGGRERSARLPR